MMYLYLKQAVEAFQLGIDDPILICGGVDGN